MTLSEDWLVVMSKPRAEFEARLQLENQGFDVYLPCRMGTARTQSAGQPVALFPRYLFVRLTAQAQSVMPIRSTRGVSQVVRFGPTMAWAPDRLIQNVRAFEHQLRQAGTPGRFKPGDQAEVLLGPFAGITADVVKSDDARVVLLLKVLGSQQKVVFDAGTLSKV